MRPEFSYVRTVVIWRFWAIGIHIQRTSGWRFPIWTFALGPLRFQFLRREPGDNGKLRSMMREQAKTSVGTR